MYKYIIRVTHPTHPAEIVSIHAMRALACDDVIAAIQVLYPQHKIEIATVACPPPTAC